MKPRTFVVWDWDRWLIWGGGFVAFLVVAVWFLASPTTGYSFAARLPGLAAPVAWAYVAWRNHSLRTRYASSIAFVTRQGVSVHVVHHDGKPITTGPARSWVEHRRGEIEAHIADVRDFWLWQFGSIDAANRIDRVLSGLHIEVVVTDKEIVNQRHGVSGAGLAYPDRLIVSLLPSEVEGGAGGYPLRFWNILEHETGHACLSAVGVAQELQHQRMRDANWGAA